MSCYHPAQGLMINICLVFLPSRGKTRPSQFPLSALSCEVWGTVPHSVWMQVAWPMGAAFLYLHPNFCLKTTALARFQNDLSPHSFRIRPPCSSSPRSITIPAGSLSLPTGLLQVHALMPVSHPLPPCGTLTGWHTLDGYSSSPFKSWAALSPPNLFSQPLFLSILGPRTHLLFFQCKFCCHPLSFRVAFSHSASEWGSVSQPASSSLFWIHSTVHQTPCSGLRRLEFLCHREIHMGKLLSLSNLPNSKPHQELNLVHHKAGFLQSPLGIGIMER